MRRALLIGLLCSLPGHAFADPASLVWGHAFSGSSDTRVRATTVDSAGNVYSAGYYHGITDFDPGPGEVLGNASVNGTYVQKLDREGNLAWARTFGGPGFCPILVRDMKTDAAANLYMAGEFIGLVDFDPGAGTVSRNAQGHDAFIMKWSMAGEFEWVQVFASNSSDVCLALELDPAGNVYGTGHFRNTLDVPGANAEEDLVAVGDDDCFVVKLNPSGNLQWARQIAGPLNDQGSSLAFDPASETLYVGGDFTDWADMNPGPSTHIQLSSSDTRDCFLVHLDLNGAYKDHVSFGGNGQENLQHLKLEPSGDLYICGEFTATIDVDPHAESFLIEAVGLQDVFVSRVSPQGDLRWGIGLGGSETENTTSLALDGAGNLYTQGSFAGRVDFDPGAGEFFLAGGRTRDIFIQKLRPDGGFVWARAIGGTGLCQNGDIGIHADRLFTSGDISGTVDIDPGPQTTEVIVPSTGYAVVALGELIDNIRPTAEITPVTPSPTNGSTIEFQVQFSEEVPDLLRSDLRIDGSGNVSYTHIDIEGGRRTYRVVFSEVEGDGSISLRINPNHALSDLEGNPLEDSTTSAVITVDNTGPGITLTAPGQGFSNGAITITARLTEATANLYDRHIGIANAALLSFTGSGAEYQLGLMPSGEQTITCSIAGSVCTDAAGNLNLPSNTLALTYDPVQPQVLSVTPITTGPTNADTVSYAVLFSEQVTGFDGPEDVVISHNGTASTGVSMSGGPREFTTAIQGVTGDGSIALGVALQNNVQDRAGNALQQTLSGDAVSIDNTAPGVQLTSPARAVVNGAIPVTATFSDRPAIFNAGLISVSNGLVQGVAGSGTQYNFTVQPGAQGNFSVSIAPSVYADDAGNPSMPSNVLTLRHDSIAPGFVNFEVTPARAYPGDQVGLRFAATESVHDLVVTVNGRPAAAAEAGEGYEYRYAVSNADTTGPAHIVISAQDEANNVGSFSNNNSLDILSRIPVARCRPVTLQLDANGQATLLPEQIDAGSTDDVEIVSRVVEPSQFTCADRGVNEVTLTVADVDGNEATCIAAVTVQDSNAICGSAFLTITGKVEEEGRPLDGVNIRKLPSGAGAVTGADGAYTIYVAPGFSGTLVPELDGYAFTPPTRSFSGVVAHTTAQDFEAVSLSVDAEGCGCTSGAKDLDDFIQRKAGDVFLFLAAMLVLLAMSRTSGGRMS